MNDASLDLRFLSLHSYTPTCTIKLLTYIRLEFPENWERDARLWKSQSIGTTAIDRINSVVTDPEIEEGKEEWLNRFTGANDGNEVR